MQIAQIAPVASTLRVAKHA